MMVERLFLAVPQGCLRFVVVVFPDHTHLLFLGINHSKLKPDNYVVHPLFKCQHAKSIKNIFS